MKEHACTCTGFHYDLKAACPGCVANAVAAGNAVAIAALWAVVRGCDAGSPAWEIAAGALRDLGQMPKPGDE